MTNPELMYFLDLTRPRRQSHELVPDGTRRRLFMPFLDQRVRRIRTILSASSYLLLM